MIQRKAQYVVAAGALFALAAAALFLVSAPAGAASSKTVTSDADFSMGEMGNDTVIIGTMEEARLELAEQDIWQQRSPGTRPTARYAPAMATVYNDDKVVLFGGYTSTGWVSETWIYDLGDNSWTRMNPAISPPAYSRPSMAGILNDDKVVMLGSTTSLWVYDVSDNAWKSMTAYNPPPARAGWSISAIPGDDKVLMFGGENNFMAEEFNGYNFPQSTGGTPYPGWATGGDANWRSSVSGYSDYWGYPYSGYSVATSGNITDSCSTWLSYSANIPGDALVSFAWNVSSESGYDYLTFLIDGVEYAKIAGTNNLWTVVYFNISAGTHTLTWRYSKDSSVTSGYDRGWIDALNIYVYMVDTWIYDISDNAWEQAAKNDHPPGRSSAGMAPVENDDKVVMFGGTNTSGPLNDTWVFDKSEYRWAKRASFRETRVRSPLLTGLGGTDSVALFERELSSNTWFYDAGDDRWTNMGSANRPQLQQSGFAALYGQDRLVAFGGMDSGMALKDATWLFRPSYANALYKSAAMDMGGASTLLTLDWDGDTPPGTFLKFQLRSAGNEAGLASTDFVGPDGTVNSFYTVQPSAIWTGHGKPSWVQVAVILETNNSVLTPALNALYFLFNRIPDVPIPVAPVDNTWTTDPMPVLYWTFRDADSMSYSYQLQISPDSSFSTLYIDTPEVRPDGGYYLPNRMPDGGWYWHVRTRDSDGAWSEYSVARLVSIDTRAPATGCDAPSGWQSANVTVALHPVDNGSGLLSTSYKLDNADWKDGTVINVSGEGTHTLTFRSVDNMGNAEPLSTVTVRIDGTAPVSGALPLPQYSLGRVLMIYFNASDSTSGIASISLMYRHEGDASFTSLGFFTASPVPFMAPSDGEYEFYTVAADAAGNREADPAAAQANTTVDTTPPSSSGDASTGWYRGEVVVTLTATDNIGLQGIYYQLDNANWRQYAGPVRISEDGVHGLAFYSADAAGNAEPVKRAVIQKDAALPVTSMAPLQTYQTSRAFYLFFNGSDATSGLAGIEIWYRSGSGGSYQQLPGLFAVSPVLFQAPSDGVYEFYTIGRDRAGNSEAVPAAAQARTTVDTSAPTPAVDLKDGKETKDSSILLKGTVEAASKVYINDVEVPVDGQGAFSYKMKLYMGPNTARITAVDPAGNSNTISRTVQKVSEPPSYLSEIMPWIVAIVVLAVLLVITLIALLRKPRQPAPAPFPGPSYPPQYPAPSPQSPPPPQMMTPPPPSQ